MISARPCLIARPGTMQLMLYLPQKTNERCNRFQRLRASECGISLFFTRNQGTGSKQETKYQSHETYFNKSNNEPGRHSAAYGSLHR